MDYPAFVYRCAVLLERDTEAQAMSAVTAQQNGSYRFVYTPDEWDEADPQMVAGCAFCHEKFTGTVTEGLVWGAAHRKRFHPMAVDRGQRERAAQAKLFSRVAGSKPEGREL